MLAFCTTCKNRTQHLEQTLPRNLNENKNAKFIILDYNSEDNLRDYLRSTHRADINNNKLIIYSMRQPLPFQMAHAKNMAHRCGLLEEATILCNLDADNFAPKGFDSYILKEINEDSYLWSRMKKGELKRGISGRIVVTKNNYLKVGGYNEIYNTWGPDDKDFNARLKNIGLEPKEIDDSFLDAVPHNHKVRFREYRHVQINENDYSSQEEGRITNETVVNQGSIGEGIVYRNFDFSNPIKLEKLPTRVFGIGLHKTATTSLHNALQILGFSSAHWPSAHWAKAIWQEMNNKNQSLTLEKNYCNLDLPIPLLYQKLDIAYPGSKFILTVRDEESWLKSIDKHFSYEHNPFRVTWDNDPFTHIVHREIYGRTNPDKEIFLERYRRHNQEVLSYFRGRLDDLLVLRTDSGWNELCRFLNRPIPIIPYPRLNTA